jgi:hypothetical protein
MHRKVVLGTLLCTALLAGCARVGPYAKTVAEVERCKANPAERKPERSPTPLTPADSAKAVTMAAVKLGCTGSLQQ